MPKLIVVIFTTMLGFASGGFMPVVAAIQTRSGSNIDLSPSADRFIPNVRSSVLTLKKCTLKRYRRPRL
jgi:hypothetical protein